MGGVIGHIQHPFENLSLTFNDCNNLIQFVLTGQYSDNNKIIHRIKATEKLDGQQLSVSWLNNRGLVVARNKGHVKMFGETSLDRDKLINKFQSHPCFYAFLYAYDSLDSVISLLSDDQRFKIFGNGRKWMSLEVIYPDTTNIINYNQKLIFFHYTVQYSDSGKFVKLFEEDGQKLFEMLPYKHVENYTFKPPIKIPIEDVSIWKIFTLSSKTIQFYRQISNIMNNYNLKLSDTIGKYLERHFLDILMKNINLYPIPNPNEVVNKIIRRFVYGDKNFTLSHIKKIDKDLAEWVKTYEKEELKLEFKYARRPFEKCFLELGTLLLANISNRHFLMKGNYEIEQEIKFRLLNVINDISIVNRKLNHQIYLLNEISDTIPNHIMATEGIVFKFKDNELYKLTGSYSCINQLLGDKYNKK